MRICGLFLIAVFVLGSGGVVFSQVQSGTEPVTLELKYEDSQKADYAKQLEEEFGKRLKADAALAKEFAAFERASDSGRYSGVPEVAAIEISCEEDVDFRDGGGRRDFQRKIALYYRFDEGVHKGVFTHSGFFALFLVTGKVTYAHRKGDDFDLTNAVVVATFQGFSRTLEGVSPAKEIE